MGATETIVEPQQGAKVDLNFLQMIEVMGTYVFHHNVLYFHNTHLVNDYFHLMIPWIYYLVTLYCLNIY